MAHRPVHVDLREVFPAGDQSQSPDSLEVPIDVADRALQDAERGDAEIRGLTEHRASRRDDGVDALEK
jgi:hypothetical protein